MEQLEKTNKNLPSQISSQNNLAVVKKVSDSTDTEIKQAMAYIISLVGVPADKIPVGVTKDMMVNYIKTKWGQTEISELQSAFEWAVEGQAKNSKGESITNLFGRPFNIEYLKSVVVYYRESKATQSRQIEGMPNHKRVESLFGIIKEKQPELYEKLKQIGKEKPRVEVEPIKPSNDPFQRWMRQYDNLQRKYLHADRFVKIGETVFNIDSFLDRKLNNYNK